MNTYVVHGRPTVHGTDFRAPDFGPAIIADDSHPLRARGPKHPPHNPDAPILDGMDMAGLAAAIIITLGPLAAYAVGMGA